jgi:hypothetical protein
MNVLNHHSRRVLGGPMAPVHTAHPPLTSARSGFAGGSWKKSCNDGKRCSIASHRAPSIDSIGGFGGWNRHEQWTIIFTWFLKQLPSFWSSKTIPP